MAGNHVYSRAKAAKAPRMDSPAIPQYRGCSQDQDGLDDRQAHLRRQSGTSYRSGIAGIRPHS